MKVIYPAKLQLWDEIRVIAPARSLALLWDETVNKAMERLKSLWFKVTFWKNVTEKDEFLSSSVHSRIEDLHDAFKDTSVKAILSVIGWYNSNQMLDYIDYDVIKNNPKILCWFSDITALSNAIFTKTWLVWYSWPHFSSWGIKYGFDYSIEYFKKCCLKDTPFDVIASQEWSDDEWYLDQEKRIFEKNEWYIILNEWDATWRIIWWHLPCICALLWTPYFPHIDEDILLFIEQDEEFSTQIFDRQLQQIIQTPYFHFIKWIVIWKFQRKNNISIETLKKIIYSKQELNNIPIIGNVNIGHVMPFITFPIGWIWKISTKNHMEKISITHH